MGPNSGQSTNTVSNTNAYIPDWLEGYTKNAVSRADDLSNQAYTPYSGESVAGQDPAQQQAYNTISAMQGMGANGWESAVGVDANLAGQASPVTAGGIQAGTNTLQQGFNSQVYNPAQGLLGAYASQGPATAAGVGANASQLMSPYTQNVIDPMLQAGEQQRLLARQQIAGQANNVGAFGGSRQGVAEGASDAAIQLGTQQQIGNMLNQGWGNALQSGTNIGLQAGAQGLTANTGLANLLSGGYGANQAASQNMANTNLSAGLTASQQLTGALTGQQNASLGQANALNQAGALQQQQRQNVDNANMAGFAQQQAFPYQQIQALLGAVSGVPYSTSNTGTFNQNTPYYSDPYGQIVGGVATTGGLLGNVGNLINSTNTTKQTATA